MLSLISAVPSVRIPGGYDVASQCITALPNRALYNASAAGPAAAGCGAEMVEAPLIQIYAADVHFKMIDRWALNAEEARYELHIELSMPIDTVLLQCDVPIELIDADTNSAIVSRTPSVE